MKTLKTLGFACFALTTASVIHAATITWDAAATNIAGATDVSLNGDSLWAYSLGGAGATVNTVAFTGISTSNTDFNFATLTNSNATAFGNTNGASAFQTLSGDYQSILESGNFVGEPDSFATYTLGGLTIGHTYEVQFWINDARNRSDMESVPREATIIGTSIVVDYNTAGANTNAGLGQYILGTFTADGTTQTFGLTANARQLNAIQLRTTAVPEPGTYALIAGMLALTSVMARRRES